MDISPWVVWPPIEPANEYACFMDLQMHHILNALRAPPKDVLARPDYGHPFFQTGRTARGMITIQPDDAVVAPEPTAPPEPQGASSSLPDDDSALDFCYQCGTPTLNVSKPGEPTICIKCQGAIVGDVTTTRRLTCYYCGQTTIFSALARATIREHPFICLRCHMMDGLVFCLPVVAHCYVCARQLPGKHRLGPSADPRCETCHAEAIVEAAGWWMDSYRQFLLVPGDAYVMPVIGINNP